MRSNPLHQRVPFARPVTASQLVVLLAMGAVLVTVSHALDRPVYEAAIESPPSSSDVWGILRGAGYAPAWIAIAIAMMWTDLGRQLVWPLRSFLTRGTLVVLSALSAGGLAEVLKIILRRERPIVTDGRYTFRAWNWESWWVSGNLGLPSSHAAVAFGATAMLTILHPRLWFVWLAIGVGCSYQRVATRAHFVSDTALGLVVGVAMAVLWWNIHTRSRPGDPAYTG